MCFVVWYKEKAGEVLICSPKRASTFLIPIQYYFCMYYYVGRESYSKCYWPISFYPFILFGNNMFFIRIELYFDARVNVTCFCFSDYFSRRYMLIWIHTLRETLNTRCIYIKHEEKLMAFLNLRIWQMI